MKEFTAKDVMSTDVVWIPDHLTLTELIDFFQAEKISGAPVVDENGIMVGVVSLRDIVQNGLPEEGSAEPKTSYYSETWEAPLSEEEMEGISIHVDRETTVTDIMTPIVFSVTEETPILECADTMLRGRIHRLVVTHDDELTGILTSLDILKIIREVIETRPLPRC